MERDAIALPATPGWGKGRALISARSLVLFTALACLAPSTALASQPTAETVGAPIRTTATAQLGGRVDPGNEAATYFFEYGAQGSCDSNPCAQTAPRQAGSGDLIELVSEEVRGLKPSTTYHYRVVADNAADTVAGNDMTVTTRASEAPLSHGHFPGPPGSDRAYEQISPPDTGGHPVNDGLSFSADGNRALFSVAGGTPSSDTGNFFTPFLAERTSTGWQARLILPPRNLTPGSPHWELFPDVSISTVLAAVLSEGTGELEIWRLGRDTPPSKLFKSSEAMNGFPGPGISDDGSLLRAVFNQDPQNPAQSTLGPNVYELTAAGPRLVSLLPDGLAPDCGVQLESSLGSRSQHTISADGSSIFFGSKGHDCQAPTRVYVRELGTEKTKLISPPPVSGDECDVVFLSSSLDAAFFWTQNRLVAEDSPGGCDQENLDGDIYRYDLHDGALRCVSCVKASFDADVYAPLNGGTRTTAENIRVSEDGSRVYFSSPHALVPGAPDVQGGGSTYRVNVNTGELAWVAGPNVGLQAGTATLTPDGAAIFFMSKASFLNPLNGSDNGGTLQYYRYDDRDRSLVCISCPKDGSPARQAVVEAHFGGGPGITAISNHGDDIVFSSTTPLVPLDQNTPRPGGDPEGGRDVYEWRDGRHLLVTDGLTNTTPGTEGPSADAISGDGRDIYFVAPTQYTPDALDGYRRLYDARIGGGFEYPTPPPPCPLEVCQGTPKGAPEEAAPGTRFFSGPGNVKPRHKKRHVKHRKRSATKHAKRGKLRANHERRTSQ